MKKINRVLGFFYSVTIGLAIVMFPTAVGFWVILQSYVINLVKFFYK